MKIKAVALAAVALAAVAAIYVQIQNKINELIDEQAARNERHADAK